MNQTEDQAVIRQYLLGYSDADTAEAIELRLVANDEYLQEFSMVTDELIEDYLGGNLSAAEATRFQTHFLKTPRRLRKLEIAKALLEKAAPRAGSNTQSTGHSNVRNFPQPEARHQRYWQVAALVSIVVFAGLIAWAILRNRSTVPGGELQAELLRLNSPGPAASAGPSVQLSIVPVTVRALGEDRRVVVGADTQTVVIRLGLVDKVYDSYQASLQTVEGNELGKIPPLKPVTGDEGRFIEVRLPAQRLQAHHYRIRLRALTAPDTYEDVGVYPFQIVR
jgi:hypothetical protein